MLIGQFNNLWTMGLTGNLRIYIDRSTQSFSYEVLDRQNPGKAIFSAVRNASRPEEYAVVEPHLRRTDRKDGGRDRGYDVQRHDRGGRIPDQ